MKKIFWCIFFVGCFFYLKKDDSVLAALCSSYLTCHFQSGGSCTPVDKQFEVCQCLVNTDGSCTKVQYRTCTIQSECNIWIRGRRVEPLDPICPSYGDCCGCTGIPKKIPLVTPTVKPLPLPIVGCYTPCATDLNCSGGLKCGYIITAGRRVCLNSACPRSSSCKCSWQAF